MEQTIETLQNELMERICRFGLMDQTVMLHELADFCEQQALEAMKVEYGLPDMEDNEQDIIY